MGPVKAGSYVRGDSHRGVGVGSGAAIGVPDRGQGIACKVHVKPIHLPRVERQAADVDRSRVVPSLADDIAVCPDKVPSC